MDEKSQDLNNINNWYATQIVKTLAFQIISVPLSLNKTMLKALYNENKDNDKNGTKCTSRSRSPISATNVHAPVTVNESVQNTSYHRSEFATCMHTLNSTLQAFIATIQTLAVEHLLNFPNPRKISLHWMISIQVCTLHLPRTQS